MYHILWLMLRAGNSKKSNSATFEVSEVYRHAKYKTYFTDDIALIRVKTPLTISDTIRPICFKDFDKKSFQNCYTAGWGMRGPGENFFNLYNKSGKKSRFETEISFVFIIFVKIYVKTFQIVIFYHK